MGALAPGVASTRRPIDSAVAKLMASGIAGAVVAQGAAERSPQLLTYGFMGYDRRRRMRPTARFKLASLSKPLTASAILRLAGAGALSLDQPLHRSHPLAEKLRGAARRITLRHLLQHSAGWDRDEDLHPFAYSGRALGERLGRDLSAASSPLPVLAAFTERELQFEPGTRYSYSNLGYCWLGAVIEHATNKPLEAAVHSLVPAARALTLDPRAVDVGHGLSVAQEDILMHNPSVISAAGGWIGCASAYWAFASAPVDGRAYAPPPYGWSGNYYGLGWRVWPTADGAVLTHYGAMPGVFSVVCRAPGGVTTVALFNGRPPDDAAAFDAILSAATDT